MPSGEADRAASDTAAAPDGGATGAGATDPGEAAATERVRTSFQQLLDQNPLGALVVDHEARVVLHNERASVLLGTHHDDLGNGRFQHPLAAEPYDIVRRDTDGAARTLRIRCAPFDGLGHGAWSVTILDVSALAEPSDPDRLGAGSHDTLTGLPGRELFLNHVFEAGRRSPSHDEARFAVVVVDLERFVRVNDEHGREAGDRVLQAVATRLTSAVRPGDYVSRIGGDEFAVVLPAQPLAAHLVVADRIDEVLSRPVVIDGADVFCAAVIGVAEHVAEDDEHSVLARAEQAMVASSPGAIHLAPRPSDQDPSGATRPGANVARAVSEGQMFLHYQPMFSIGDNSVVALEALVRWDHPDDGLIPPDEFIRIAEERGGIVSLGTWVVAEVCEQIAAWRDAHPDYLVPPVTINVSARQLGSSELHDAIHTGLARHHLAPDVLLLEVTEEVLLDHDPRVEALLRELVDSGIGLLLDEFGTGLASLTHLRRFPLDGIKIDRSFVTRLMTDEPSAQLVLAVIEAARAFDLPVTAVGVETSEQKGVLARWGCDGAQGHLLARPVSAVEAPRFFERDPESLRVRPQGPLLRSSGTFDRPSSP